MLSLPVSLGAWYWGKLLGRFATVFLPVALALCGAIAYGAIQGATVPWRHFGYDIGLLLSLAFCFLGIGFLISSLARSSDVAQSAAFVLWLGLLLFMDLILLGLLMRDAAPAQLVVGIALTNPLQVFRTASMMLFDPQLVLLGPAAFVILDHFGQTAYLVWAIVYPGLLGAACAWGGFQVFRRGDYP
jgi:ABC-2 type transport system permease protein